MDVTIALDNNVPISAAFPFKAEHGAAFLVEIDERRILLDTGQSGVVVENLALLGTHPAELDMIVLSHGHYDHAGGLEAVLRLARADVEVVMHARAWGARYVHARSGRKPIGIPGTREALRGLGGRWDERETPRRITENLWWSGSVPRVSGFEGGDPRLVDAADRPDAIPDDSSLFCRGPKGLVVISGCAHAGLVNTVLHGFAVTGLDRLQGWIGGTHLGPASADQQEQTIARLRDWNPDFVAANHCTGFAMMARLAETFGKGFIPAFVGTRIKVNTPLA